MRDIVERLETHAYVADKTQSGMAPLFEECLEEITRLRAENEKFYKQAEMNARLLTENESLRGEVEMLKINLPARAATRGLAEQHNEITHLRADNEKLRKALRPYADKYHWDIKHYDEVMSYGDLKAHDFYAAAAALGETDE